MISLGGAFCPRCGGEGEHAPNCTEFRYASDHEAMARVRSVRCPHGFDREVVACVTCDAKKPKAKRKSGGGGVERMFSAANAHTPGTRPAHSSFIDLTGKTLGALFVVQRVENGPNGNAQWQARLPCGHLVVRTGISLRASQHRKRWHCAECRAGGA